MPAERSSRIARPAPPTHAVGAAGGRARCDGVICGALAIAGLIHLLPLPGVLGASLLHRLYGLDIASPDALILLQHRALLFGLLGGFLLGAIRMPIWRTPALLGGLLSASGFLVVAFVVGDFGAPLRRVVIADVVALAALLVAGIVHWRR